MKVICVRDLQALHPVDMAGLLKVIVKVAVPPVCMIATYLTFVTLAQPVQSIQPVGDGPSMRERPLGCT